MKPRILIVEDESLMARVIAQHLMDLGYDPVATTAYGEEAISLAEARFFDLALVDIGLAGNMDGIEAATTMQKRFGLASVFLTTNLERCERGRMMEAEPFGYVGKPFTAQELYLVIEMAMQRRRTESALRESEQRLESVLQTSMDAFWIWGVDGRIIDMNAAACRMTGYSREELLQMNLVQIDHGRTPEQIAADIERLIQLGSVQVERQQRRKDGQIRYVEISVTCSPPPTRLLYCFGRDVTERRLSEKALHESEHHLRSTLDSIPDAIMLKDSNGRYLAVNTVWCKIYSQRMEDVIGKTDFELFPLEQATQHWQRDEKMRTTFKPLRAEVEHTSKEGRTVWLEILKAPRFDDKGSYLGMVGVARDITALRSTKKRLELLDRAVEQSPVSIVITDPQGTIEYVNPYFEKHTGYTLKEALGQNPRVLKSAIHPPAFYKDLWDTIIAGNEWRGEMCNRRKDGTLYWEQVSISPLRDALGKVVNFVAVKEDITDRKQSEQTIAWQAALFSNTSDICCVKNLDLRILTCNAAMAELAGQATPAALIGKTDAEVFGRAQNEPIIEGYMTDELAAQKLAPGKVLEREEKMIRHDGVERCILTRKFPVFDQNSQLIATGNISTDITDRKKTEDELVRAKDEAESANRAKSAFLAMMSHELRTPLNVINGMSALLGQDNWPPEHKHAIDLISEGGHNLLNIVEEILDYSGLQAGKTKLDASIFSVVTVIGNVLRSCSASAETKNLNLTCWLDPKTPAEAIGDPRRLRQILVNLLSNAIKFTEYGRIHLGMALRETTSQAYTLEFSVTDSGVGIAPKNVDKLFRPFSQADDTITRRYGGTGLGLAITKSFVNLMGGEIEVLSRLGIGSVFRFHINLQATSNRALAFSGQSLPLLQNRRVALLAGKGAQHRMLESLLRGWGMQPVVLPLWLPAADRPELQCDLAILPVAAATDAQHPLSHWLAEPGRGAKIPVVWLGLKNLTPPVCCTAPSTRLGTVIDPIELRQMISDLLNTTSAATQKPSGKANKPRPLGETIPLSILAAEDNATNREVIKLVLRNLGYTVDMVENGLEAVHAVKSKKYDLLLLDMQMPVMDGLTAAEEICKLIPDPTRRVKIVALTANALPGDRERCLAAGMDAYLTKPILPVDLAACIRRVFEGTESQPPGGATPVKQTNHFVEHPLVDTTHLETITTGMAPEQALEALNQLQVSVCDDYQINLPRVLELCAQQDQAGFAETVHGLKGCFMMIGWNRAGTRCAEALVEARKGSFKEWATFTDELEKLFSQSSCVMRRYLDDLATKKRAPAAPSDALPSNLGNSTP